MLRRVLIIAGVHGVEPQSAYFAQRLLEDPEFVDFFGGEFLEHSSLIEETIPHHFEIFTSKQGITPELCYFVAAEESSSSIDCAKSIDHKNIAPHATLIPLLNPQGLRLQTRGNANGVDLNRNMPTKNWAYSEKIINAVKNPYYPGVSAESEIETQCLMPVLKNGSFDLYISMHTNHFVQNANDPMIVYDGPKYKAWLEGDYEQELHEGYKAGQSLAQAMNLPFSEDIGYPTPGSFGSYAIEHNIPCLTFEFDDTLSSEETWEKHRKPFINCLKAILRA